METSCGSVTRSPLQPSEASVVIACFNEAGTIGPTLDGLLANFPNLEIIVVDDGSTDDCMGEIEQRRSVILIRNNQNRGQGASLVTGMKHATRPYVIWYDADGQHTPEMVAKVLAVQADFDCVIGLRSRHSDGMRQRRLGRWLLHVVARIITGAKVRDLNSGLRSFRREVICKYWHLIPNRFSASTVTTILMIERGFRVGWVDIDVQPRIGHSSLSQMRDGWRALALIVHLVTLFHPMRFFFPLAVSLIVGGACYGLVRAIFAGRGIPDLAVLVVLTGIQILLFGLVSDQISAIRKEKFE